MRASWQRFLDAFEPLRPELYRYCRHLTRTPWDAEDLAQDTMARAFVTLGTLFGELPEPRGWLFRVASNAWIDRVRRERFSLEPMSSAPSAVEPQSTREAAGTLLALLSPQERVAFVLKDVFDFSLEEVARVLGTTVGAVKAALSRGRSRLREDAPAREERVPAVGALEAFAHAFNAGDLEQLTALLLDSASVEIVGLVTEYGADAPKNPLTGSFAGTLAPLTIDERGGVPSELLEGYLERSPRCEVRAYRDGWLLVFWYDHVEGPFVRTLMRVETNGDRIARVQNYFFSPQVIAEVCEELGVPHRANGYRYWLPEP
ncbi:MAG: family polymerase sigma factor [Polyangiaceae bacterium]|nr:family polymerase sigma factor [Polyangiaceae bacterium]